MSKQLSFCFCLENFKRQSWKNKLENWHEPSNKSEITAPYMEKNNKFTGSHHKFLIFLQLSVVVDGVEELVFVSVVVEADDLPAPTLWNYLLLLPLSPPLALENSLSNSCWTDGCWFFIHQPFWYVYTCLYYFFWGILTIHDSAYERDALNTGCLYCLNKLIDCFAGLCRVFTFNFVSK